MKKMRDKIIKKSVYVFLLFVLFFGISHSDLLANELSNPSFEEELGSATERNWDSSNGATRLNAVGIAALGAGFTANPPDGNFAISIVNNTDFTFQNIDEVQPGDFVSFSGLAEASVIAPSGGEFRIEFKKKYEDGTDETISTVQSTRINTTTAPAGGGYTRFTVTGIAPVETERVVFTLRGAGGGGGFVIFDNVNGEINPSKLAVRASKNRVKAGEIITIYSTFDNRSAVAFNRVRMQAEIPNGFDVVGDSVRLNGRPTFFQEGSLIIPVGTINAGQRMDALFQLVVTSGVAVGKNYTISITLNNGNNLSETVFIHLNVIGDPVFDEGTIIGKVFQDENQNGHQDEGEKGVPWVKLVTEEGIVVVTDAHGRYHIPAVKAGRHVVKIDGHSLPSGTKFITEEAFLVKTTPGIMNKANFAVLVPPSTIPEKFQEELTVTVSQGLDTSRPVLDVQMAPDVLKLGVGVLETEPLFQFKLNYPEYVRNWYLEVRDEMGREVWTGFGVSSPPREVPWTGETEAGFITKEGIYSYQLKVEDQEGRQDWTPLKFFRVISKLNPAWEEKKLVEIPPLGNFNIFQDGKQSIPLVAKPTISVRGKTKPGYSVAVNKYPVEVDTVSGLFQTELYTSPGEKEIQVTATSPEGESTTYRHKIEIKDSMFFMVGLGEEQLGVNFQNGDIVTAGQDGTLKEGFYEDGRLSFYLKGKLRGKFLVKCHYDTSDERSELFTNLDPDEYYPIYGDASTRDYDAQDTQDRLYVLVEMDRSFARWGTFKTQFTDTELATYNRTLSGLKAHYESLDTTDYGDPKRAFKLFWAESSHQGDHNEFAATGGSLYYLRNRNVVEGSEKIRVETRDKIQDIPVDSYDLKEGQDYEIDYNEGRILLSRPLSSVGAADTLITSDLLDGSPVYLIVDYEYEGNLHIFETGDRGIRGYTHMGQHIRIGGTAVEEKRNGQDYDMRGVDATLKLGRNTKVTAEYAETKLEQVDHAVSFNGGLSFVNLDPISGPGQRTRENAYSIKAESKPVKNLELSGYLQGVEPGFSTDRIRSQEGYKKYGVNASYRLKDLTLRYRYDHNEVVGQLMPLNEHGMIAPFDTVETQTIQAKYDYGKILAEAEYRRQVADIPEDHLSPTLLSEVPFENGVAGKVGYRLNERLMPYVKAQMTFQEKQNHQFGGGLRYEVVNNLFGYVEQMVGNLGDSTFFGLEQMHENGGRSYANLRMRDRGIGSKALSTAIGSSFPLSQKSRVYTEQEHSSYDGVDGFADILGIEGKAGDRWDVDAKYERRHLDNASTRLLDVQASNSLVKANTTNAVSGSVAYADGDKLRSRVHLEVRWDHDDPRLWQWVSRNSLEYKMNEDFSLLGKLDYGKSRFLDPKNKPADFMELNAGLAYRPVSNDRLNAFARYAYLRNMANDLQFDAGIFSGLATDEQSHLVAIDIAYELHRFLTVVEKMAYKNSIIETPVTQTILHNLLWAHRFNFHVTRKWDLALEYRFLWQFDAARTLKQGALVEIDREFYDYVRLGVGYNFTDFDDDLRKVNNYDTHGPFVRLSGKF
ncbi:MAG: hypothetical protein JW893_06815 [Candidatus Omnitrophica bacterium]|nr:hypothetical protein [Candidatus Omnitrophota bacterium]